MEVESIRVMDVIPAPPGRVYEAWLDEAEHSAFTGGKATVEPRVGGRFTAWDNYISGVTEDLVPGTQITQRWRSTDFPQEAADSRVVVTFADDPGGALVTIDHTDIPIGQGKSYEDGWVQYYFVPMKTYFTRADSKGGGAKPSVKKAGAKKTTAKKTTAKKTTAKKTTEKKKRKTMEKKTTAKKTTAKKAAPAKKTAAKKTAAKKTAKKAAPAKKTAAKKTAAKKTTKKAAKKTAAKKTAATKS